MHTMHRSVCKDIYLEHDPYTYWLDDDPETAEQNERLRKESIEREKRRIKEANSNVKCVKCTYGWNTKSKTKYLTCCYCKKYFRNPHYAPIVGSNEYNEAKFFREFEAETIRLENLKRQRLGLRLTLPGTNSNSNNNVPRPKRRSRIVG